MYDLVIRSRSSNQGHETRTRIVQVEYPGRSNSYQPDLLTPPRIHPNALVMRTFFHELKANARVSPWGRHRHDGTYFIITWVLTWIVYIYPSLVLYLSLASIGALVLDEPSTWKKREKEINGTVFTCVAAKICLQITKFVFILAPSHLPRVGTDICTKYITRN